MEKKNNRINYRTVRMASDIVRLVQEIATKNRRPMTSQWRLIIEMWQTDHPDEVDPNLRKIPTSGK